MLTLFNYARKKPDFLPGYPSNMADYIPSGRPATIYNEMLAVGIGSVAAGIYALEWAVSLAKPVKGVIWLSPCEGCGIMVSDKLAVRKGTKNFCWYCGQEVA